MQISARTLGQEYGLTAEEMVSSKRWLISSQPLRRNKQRKNLWNQLISEVFGPSGATRTRGFHIPNVAPYQLGYTRIFNFCHYITAGEKIKGFSVCGHLCGQNRSYATFSSQRKSSKRRCRKALRRFFLTRPGYSHGTPKPGALPTALYPDIWFCRASAMWSHSDSIPGHHCYKAKEWAVSLSMPRIVHLGQYLN